MTERVLLGPSVLILPFYHPLILGKQLATLDHMSKGRVYLAVGVGERPKIHEIYGVPMHERGASANEYIEIMKGMWTQPTYHYSGKFFQFGDIPQEATYQKPHIPIWIGGRIGGVEIGPDGERRFKSKRAAMRRAGRYGDGWIPYFTTPDVYKGTVQTVTDDAKQYGRDDHPITMAMHLFGVVKDDYDEALQLAAEYNPFGGHRAEFSARYDLARIHRRRASGQCPEVARGCFCESGIMVLKQQSRPQNKEHPIDATTQPSRSHPNRV